MTFRAISNRLQKRSSRYGGDILYSTPPGAGRIACEIIDPMGQPLGGADVSVSALGTRQVLVRGMADPYGRYTATLPVGRYTLMVAAEGLSPRAETVEVTAGATTPGVRVELEPARHLELPRPGTWLFDPPHTAIRFIAKHVGMAHIHGRFTRFDGIIDVAEDMANSQVSVQIDASSISTGNSTRDNHLRSADFLDVENFPYIDFTSSRFAYHGGSKWTVHGALSMHGISRSVALDTSYLGTVNGGYEQELRCAALAKTELHREDFTLNWRSMLARGIAIVGPTIQLELDVQAMFHTQGTPIPPR